MPPYIPKDESGIKGHQQTLSDNPEECLRVVLECLKMSGCQATVSVDACMVLALGVR